MREKKTTTKEETFGDLISTRRRQLKMTQKEVAARVGTSVPYIGYLEGNRRHPSSKVVFKLAEMLGLESRELFFLANPQTKLLVSQPLRSGEVSAWGTFAKDKAVHKIHNITDQEMKTLSMVASIGDVRSPADFIFILNAIRQALGK
jgi:transcriptional regulator with XRE-family HTH domain